MTLNEFINRRMAELGLKYVDVTACVSGRTLQKIRAGDTAGIREGTFQKLALVLQCSIGELKACCTEQNVKGAVTEHELELLARENGEHPVMDAVDRREEVKKEMHPEAAEPEREGEKKMKVYPDVTKEASEKVPVKKEVIEDLFPDESNPDSEILENENVMDVVSSAVRAAVNVYKRKLKDICLKKMVEFRLGEDQAEDLYSDIGKALLEELMKEDQKAV